MGAGKKPAKLRARTERREVERALRRDVRERERLVRLAPGGAPDRAIVVGSVAVVEGRARSERCIQCGGELELQRHDVSPADAQLREIALVCRLCHARRQLWIRVQPALPS